MAKMMKGKKSTETVKSEKRVSKWYAQFTPTWATITIFFMINALDIIRAILTEKNIGAVVNILDYILLPITKLIFVVVQPTYVSLALLSVTVFIDLVWKYVLAALIARYVLKK